MSQAKSGGAGGSLRGDLADLAFTVAELAVAVAKVQKLLAQLQAFSTAYAAGKFATAEEIHEAFRTTQDEVSGTVNKVFAETRALLERLADADDRT